MPVAQVQIDVGDADAVDEQRALRADELDGVARERFEVVDEPGPRLDHAVGDLDVGLLVPLDEQLLPRVHAALVHPDLRAVLDLLEDLGADVVDEHDVVRDDHLGTEIRVPARDRRGRVDHRGDARFDERVGGDAVEVDGIEDDHVTGTDPAQQFRGVPVDPGNATHSGQRFVVTGQQRRHLHARDDAPVYE